MQGVGGLVQGDGPGGEGGFVMDAAAEEEAASAGVEVVGDDGLVREDFDVGDAFLLEEEAGDFGAGVGVGGAGVACASHGLLVAGGRVAAGHQGDGDEQDGDEEEGHRGVWGGEGGLSITELESGRRLGDRMDRIFED